MKIDLNKNSCQWKHLAKQVCDFTKEKIQNSKISELSIEDISEVGIYDAPTRSLRKDLLRKKTRRIFVGTQVFLKVVLRNKLSTSLSLRNIKLVCQVSGEGNEVLEDGLGYSQQPQVIQLPPHRSQEVILAVTPTREGTLELKSVEWELFDLVKCSKDLSSLSTTSKSKTVNSMLKFKVIESSAECSVSLNFDPKVSQSDDHKFELSECREGFAVFKNNSRNLRLKNGFFTCSHPLLFNFDTKQIFDEVGPESEVKVPMVFRAGLLGLQLVKFLLRYEVDGEGVTESSRFRF